ncbi:hypothetical protein [Aquipseudomonas alcaligenes]|uniref:hypothetical protein n=1 Tax=Aquipseudomonas alcaligenes TaxID=43263 RepID=UPI00097062D0|nr:hypothetical protein [Pseudomonas alcaligenes]
MADYTERYVAFIDILGFREHVKSIDTHPEKLDHLLSILKEIATNYTGLSRNVSETQGFEHMLRVTAFSDNVVISGRHDKAGLLFVLAVCSSLSVRLLQQGVLARGGITQGKLFHSEAVVIGDGLIKAYELESKTAIYPRVIIDPAIRTQAIELAAENNFEQTYKPFTIVQDFDGLFFLNYLGVTVLPEYSKSSSDHFLEKVRQEIIDGLNKAGSLGVKAKLGWMARYLNEHAEILQMETIPLE